jgi:hypothetical protein
MRSVSLLALSAVALVGLSGASAGCSRPCTSSAYEATPSDSAARGPSNSGAPVSAPSPGTTTPADAGRLISEADIVQLDHEQNYVYAISKSGGLSIVDASQPRTLKLLGGTQLGGVPFEMYRRGNVLLTMSNYGINAAGAVAGPVPNGQAPTLAPPDHSAVISAVDVGNPANVHTLKTLAVPGEIADSRVVGTILYLATFENGQCYSCASTLRTVVTTFDIADPLAPKQIDQVAFNGPDSGVAYGGGWATPWKRSIVATTERLYVGGLAANATTSTDEGVIEVLDITDPNGHLVRGAKIATSGPIMSRWQMDEHDGVLRVISQRGAGRTQNGEKFPDVDTFRIESTKSFLRVGHTTMTLPRQEGLKTVRFDGPRAYAITFFQGDPLFTIDLSDAANPTQRGQVEMPGWVYHLEPRGDRLIGLGLDRRDGTGNLNVSLFDVADLASPHLLVRQSFGPTGYAFSDAQIANGVLAEDQDRIQKAFRIFDDGLIAIPFTGSSYYSGGACAVGSGVQLMEWSRTSLVKRGLLPVAGNPRRAIRRDSGQSQELIAVSDSNVTSFDIVQRSAATQTADVVIGTCVPRPSTNIVPVGGGSGPFLGNDVQEDGYGYDGSRSCH